MDRHEDPQLVRVPEPAHLPALSPQPPAPSATAADFAPTPARRVPTLTEEEEAEEEQIQLERSHSSAREQPAGQLGCAVSFSSSAAAGLAVLSLRRRSSRIRADHLSVSRSVPPLVRLGLVVSPGICRQPKPNACFQPPREAGILSNVPTRSRSIL